MQTIQEVKPRPPLCRIPERACRVSGHSLPFVSRQWDQVTLAGLSDAGSLRSFPVNAEIGLALNPVLWHR